MDGESHLSPPKSYRCVMVRPWDPIGWVYMVLLELKRDGIISAEQFAGLTISLEIGGFGKRFRRR